MSSVNSTPLNSIHAQNNLGANSPSNAPNPNLIATATTIDDCWDAFTVCFEESSNASTLVMEDTKELATATHTQEQGIMIQEQAEIKHTASTQVGSEARAERAQILSDVLKAKDAHTKAYVAGVDSKGNLQLKSTANMSASELQRANDEDRLVFKHDKIIGLSPALCARLGHHDGKKITYRDEDGITHDLTVHHMDASEIKLLSNVVTQFIANMPQHTHENTKEKEESSVEKHKTKPLPANRDTTQLHKRGSRRTDHDQVDGSKGDRQGVSQKQKEIKAIEDSGIANTRDRIHDARKLSTFIEKLLRVIVAEVKEFDAQTQSLKLDNLKNGHTLSFIPRSILVK